MRSIRYEPGNDTKYRIWEMTPTAENIQIYTHSFGMMSLGARVYIWAGHGTIVIAPRGVLASTYVAEKLRCGREDAEALTRLFAHLTGREIL